MRNALLVKNVSVLALCQALFFMCNTIVISTAPLVGLQLAPTPGLATLPLGAQFVGTMLCTMPASLLMKRIGRRDGLSIGTALGVSAGTIATFAVLQGSFWLFCVSGMVYGGFSAFCQYFRFTAADAADAAPAENRSAARGRAIAWVMAGGLVAAVLGPEVAKATRELFAPILFAGCYVAVAGLALSSLATLRWLELPAVDAAARHDAGRPLSEIARQPIAVTAFLAALVGYVTMNLLMTATPLAMLACGHAFADSAFVIQWHVVGMFAPSFVTGSLIARLGIHRVILLGIALNLICVSLAFAGLEVVNFAAALFVLGAGWNFMFIGATTLLTTCHTQAEKAKVQGLNDLLVFGSVAASATLSGFLHDALGWELMNLLAVPALLAVAAIVWLSSRGSALAPAR
jgi:MFS family permease